MAGCDFLQHAKSVLYAEDQLLVPEHCKSVPLSEHRQEIHDATKGSGLAENISLNPFVSM
jgi:hypothetical protein